MLHRVVVQIIQMPRPIRHNANLLTLKPPLLHIVTLTSFVVRDKYIEVFE
jgi:hypothetical protein